MYEVFLNDSKFVITSERDIPIPGQTVIYMEKENQPLLDELIVKFLRGDESPFILTMDEKLLWKEFRRKFRLLHAAGGVVHHKKKYLFIFRKGKWDLPKGKLDPGETSEEAALREVREETGLRNLDVQGTYPSTWHIYQSPFARAGRKWILKKTDWYAMHTSDNEILIPQKEEEIELVRWFSKNELSGILDNTYTSLRKIILSL